MLLLINHNNHHKYLNELASMHRLRKRIFQDQLKWDVNIINGMEIDQFDNKNAYYLVYLKNTEVVASTRLISTIHPYLLGDVFPELAGQYEIPKTDNIWETTRFCSDNAQAPKEIMGILASGMLEFALHYGISEYVSVSDIRIETLIRRFGWSPERLAHTIDTGTEISAGERFPVSEEIYFKVRSKSKCTGQVIKNLNEAVESLSLEAA